MVSCEGGEPKGKGDNGDAETGVEAVPVETISATRQAVTDTVLATANLSSQRRVTIAASAAGHLVELTVDEGDTVEAETPLGKLTNPDLGLAVQASQAQVRRAKAEVDRLAPLVKKGYIPRAELDGATTQLELARGDLRRTQSSAGEAIVRSPISGVVAARHVDVGTLVSPGQPLLTIVDPEALEVEVLVPELALARLSIGQKAAIESAALPDHAFAGQVAAIAPIVDPTTGTVKVTIQVTDTRDAQGRQLRPGMFVEARIVTRVREDVATIPKKGLYYEEGRAYVMVVEDGKATRVGLDAGVEAGDRVEAIGPITPGAQIIVLGQAGLKDGAKVRVVRRDGAAVAAPVSDDGDA